MRQLLLDRNTGELTVDDVPAPARSDVSLLVATRASLISAGTERAAVQMPPASIVGKARARPDLVRKAIDTAREQGAAATLAKVRGHQASEQLPGTLGYSSCGVVLEAPPGSPAGPGELVACAGAGYAAHAEIVAVPRTLCARVPEGVLVEDAAYATVAAIALHGVRLCKLQIGEIVAVVGLGLVGQLTLELVVAAGCTPVGLDLDPARVELARAAGFRATADAGELVAECRRLTDGRGADGVLVTAASKSPAPLATGIEAARERSTVCIVGDVPVESPRWPLFAKEVSLVVSRSYGPGRYDPRHEERGIDYPAGYVRWTEGRNLQAVLALMARKALNPSRLTTHRFKLEDGPEAYALLTGSEPSLGILLEYDEQVPSLHRTVTRDRVRPRQPRRALGARKPRVGVIGAGGFARDVLLPKLAPHAEIAAIVTATGPSARATASRFGARAAGTDPAAIFEASDIDAVVIATRHDTHAEYVVRALEAGKHVFVEKPPAIDEAGMRAIVLAAGADGAPTLMCGFNRRFAPFTNRLLEALGGRGPLLIQYRVAAGRIPTDHWTQDQDIGGGRIVGEACHFIDWILAVTGEEPSSVGALAIEGSSEPREDNFVATLAFPGGSVATLAYTALGDTALPKERIEVVGEAGAAVLDDFRMLALYRGGAATRDKSSQDKGHAAEIEAFVQACRTGVPAQPLPEILAVMRTTFALRDAVNTA